MSKPILFCLTLQNISIFEQLQLEEALLRTEESHWLLCNYGSPPAIVMGISGNIAELIEVDSLKKNPIPLIRRFSGGGTVVVDEETLFVTLICHRTALEIPLFPKAVLHWNGDLYHKWLPQFTIKENDYAINNKKFGGNAQYLTKDRWLQHSTLLWDYTDEKMDLLKIPKRMPDYRQGRKHSDFLCTLKPRFKKKEEIFKHLKSSLSQHFELREASFEDVKQTLVRPHRKTTSLQG